MKLLDFSWNQYIYLLIFFSVFSCTNKNELDERCHQSPKYLESFELPDGLVGYNNYELALACSQMTKKPLAIYFTGFTCINCKKFEENFLYQKDVKNIISDNFIFVLLYVDDNRALPKEDQIEVTSKYSNQTRKLKTIGQLNSSLANKYEHSSHPSLFIADSNEKIISLIQYDSNKEALYKQLKDAVVKVN